MEKGYLLEDTAQEGATSLVEAMYAQHAKQHEGERFMLQILPNTTAEESGMSHADFLVKCSCCGQFLEEMKKQEKYPMVAPSAQYSFTGQADYNPGTAQSYSSLSSVRYTPAPAQEYAQAA